MSELQVRSYSSQVRAVENDGKRTIEGYAVVWDALADYAIRGPRGLYTERFAKGCFDDSVKEDDIGCYFDHKTDKLLGRTRSGTATVETDDHGVKFSCDLPDCSYANDLMRLIERADIWGCSIGFRDWTYEWTQEDDGLLIGTVTNARLFDVGPVSMPVYETTSVGMRSLDLFLEAKDRERQDREWLDYAKRRLVFQNQSIDHR